jgi:membrane dipeptidase
MPQKWFDAHLDLASLAEAGRDMRLPAEQVTIPLPPAAVTLPSLIEGNIRSMLATIFIQQRTEDADGPWTFSNEEEAHAAALRQFDIYDQWHRRGLMQLANNSAELLNPKKENVSSAMILMEGAAGVRNPADLELFHSFGLRVLTLTWGEGTKYSGGNFSPPASADITPLGRELVAKADALNLIHDVSHLSDAAFWTLAKIARRPFIASHSNCRALLPDAKCPPRHLSDEQIRAVASGGGVIGIVLYSAFLCAPQNRATIDDVLRHISHIEKITGRRDCIGLGSDMDGGFSANAMPENLDHPRRFGNLAAALANKGWSASEIDGFCFGNWANFFSKHL